MQYMDPLSSIYTNHQLKAKPFFLPAGERKPKKIYNQFGGTVGGPIRKDKLFIPSATEERLTIS